MCSGTRRPSNRARCHACARPWIPQACPMFEWWQERKRREILEQPFPEAQRAVIARNVGHYGRLTPDEQQRLRDLVQVFVAEKHWEGCGGLELDEDMKYTIAAQACMLVLELPHNLYADVESIFVYPSAV